MLNEIFPSPNGCSTVYGAYPHRLSESLNTIFSENFDKYYCLLKLSNENYSIKAFDQRISVELAIANLQPGSVVWLVHPVK